MPKRLRLFLAASAFIATFPAFGADHTWPTWRGPSGAGIAATAKPPLTWSDTQNVKWRAKIPGYGFSTPIVWQDKMFLLAAIETKEDTAAPAAVPAPAPAPADKAGKEKGPRRGGPGGGGGMNPTKVHEFVVIAVNRADGKILWQKTARREVPHEGKHATNSYASASPVTDGERLYASFGSRGLYCYDFNGTLIWEKDLGDMTTRGTFGEGSSPALAGNVLIVPWDHEAGSFIVGLDKKTGAELWRKDRDERSSWSTPLVVEVGGKLQAIVAATTRTRSYDVATGAIVWEAGGLTPNVIPTPVVGHGLVYVMSGFRGNAVQAIKLTAKGDITDNPEQIVWNLRKGTPYVPSPTLSGDRLFFTKSNDAYLACVNALTGEVHYQDQPLEGLRGIYASPLAANGHVYIVGREGMTMVIKDTAKFEIVAQNKLNDRFDASPVMLGKELYLRGHDYLYCLAE